MKRSVRVGRMIAGAMVAGLLAACGDAETTDTRGYTKAPLEQPGVRIRAEQPSQMSELRGPLQPEIVELQVNTGA